MTSCHSQSKLPGACRYGVLLRLQKPTWGTLAVRDWELVLYINTIISACCSRSAPTVRARTGPHPGALPVRVRYRRATPTFTFFSLSLDPFFFSRYSTRSASIFRFITSLYQNGALSLYFTVIEARPLSGTWDYFKVTNVLY